MAEAENKEPVTAEEEAAAAEEEEVEVEVEEGEEGEEEEEIEYEEVEVEEEEYEEEEVEVEEEEEADGDEGEGESGAAGGEAAAPEAASEPAEAAPEEGKEDAAEAPSEAEPADPAPTEPEDAAEASKEDAPPAEPAAEPEAAVAEPAPEAREDGKGRDTEADGDDEAAIGGEGEEQDPNAADMPDLSHAMEDAAATAAKVASEGAAALAGLTSSFGGMLGGFGKAAAGNDVAKQAAAVTGNLTSWWNSLDEGPGEEASTGISAEARADAAALAARGGSGGTMAGDLQKLFGLSPSESLVESFPCKLLQTYRCCHNAYTPDIQMAFQGTLYITDLHSCFNVEERGRKLPIKVAHTEVTRVERQRPSRRGDSSDVLKMTTAPPPDADPAQAGVERHMSLKDFAPGGLDSALALLEHLCDHE